MASKPVYRMSSAGYCPRRLWARRTQQEETSPPPWLSSSAAEGHWHEERIVNELRAEGLTILDQQKEVNIDSPSFLLQGHIEGRIEYPCSLFEVKSMSQFEFDRWMRGQWEEFPNYAAQITCYMHATGIFRVRYIVKNRNTGTKVEYPLEEPPMDIALVYEKLEQIELWMRQHSDNINVPVPADYQPNSIECRRCSVDRFCLPTINAEALQLRAIELEKLSELWRQGRGLVRQGMEMMESAKGPLGEQAMATGTNRLSCFGLRISVTENKPRIIYDVDALRLLFPAEVLAKAEKETEVKEPFTTRILDTKKSDE